MNKLLDMPKLESPFIREDVKGKGYVCIPKIREGFEWFINPDIVLATEKFDGTNVSVYLEDGQIKRILNRENRIDIWNNQEHFYTGIYRAIDEKKFKPERLLDGQYFGELIGPKLNGNPHEVDKPIWLPFDYIKEHYYFKFYNGWLKDMYAYNVLPTEERIYNKFYELFNNLNSLWFRQQHNGRMKHPEGIVFYNTNTGEMCKLRMDMFGLCKRNGWHKMPDMKINEE